MTNKQKNELHFTGKCLSLVFFVFELVFMFYVLLTQREFLREQSTNLLFEILKSFFVLLFIFLILFINFKLIVFLFQKPPSIIPDEPQKSLTQQNLSNTNSLDKNTKLESDFKPKF